MRLLHIATAIGVAFFQFLPSSHWFRHEKVDEMTDQKTIFYMVRSAADASDRRGSVLLSCKDSKVMSFGYSPGVNVAPNKHFLVRFDAETPIEDVVGPEDNGSIVHLQASYLDKILAHQSMKIRDEGREGAEVTDTFNVAGLANADLGKDCGLGQSR